jgi:tetratricopeptide (TPR) repeat protein
MRTALLVSLLLGAAAALPAQTDFFGGRVKATLEQIRQDPEAYKNVKVEFKVQFASLGRLSNPFFTQFTPHEFANFHAWSHEQPIWREQSYKDVFGMLFLSKSNPNLDKLYEFDIYQGLRLTGVVRNIFQNMPWIEVLDFEPIEGKLDTPTLTHLYRGEKHMEQRQWQRAIAELSQANIDELPPPAARAALKNLGVCSLRLGETDRAVAQLEAANALGKDAEVVSLLQTARRAPGLGLDRVTDAPKLKDSERPIWDAFETGDKPPARPAR